VLLAPALLFAKLKCATASAPMAPMPTRHFFFAAHGLQGLQAFLAAQGLQPPQAFFAAQGLQALAFLAAHGLHAFFGAQAAIAAGKLAVAVIVAMAALVRTRFNMVKPPLVIAGNPVRQTWRLAIANANQLMLTRS